MWVYILSKYSGLTFTRAKLEELKVWRIYALLIEEGNGDVIGVKYKMDAAVVGEGYVVVYIV